MSLNGDKRNRKRFASSVLVGVSQQKRFGASFEQPMKLWSSRNVRHWRRPLRKIDCFFQRRRKSTKEFGSRMPRTAKFWTNTLYTMIDVLQASIGTNIRRLKHTVLVLDKFFKTFYSAHFPNPCVFIFKINSRNMLYTCFFNFNIQKFVHKYVCSNMSIFSY